AYDAFHGRVALAFRPQFRPDFLLLHFQSTDWAGHYFFYYHAPSRFALLQDVAKLRERLDRDRPAFGGTLTAFYEFADEWLGKLLDGRDGETGVAVLSDHGMDPLDNLTETGDHNGAPPGILVLNGPGIRRGHRVEGATIYDVLPTLAGAAGLPVARDLEG